MESADADLATTNPSAKFLSKVPAGIDIKNTVKALLARYYNIQSMITGTYNSTAGNKAMTFAAAASLTIKSEFRFTAAKPNPLGEWNFTVNVFGPIDSTLGLKNGPAPVPACLQNHEYVSISADGANLLFRLKAFALKYYSIISCLFARRNEFDSGGETMPARAYLAQSKTALDLVRTKNNRYFRSRCCTTCLQRSFNCC